MTRKNVRWLSIGVAAAAIGAAGLYLAWGGPNAASADPSQQLRDHTNTAPITAPGSSVAAPFREGGTNTPGG